MHLLRNLSRRKLRTGLTVAGITIGIWALVVFSAMANRIDSMVQGSSRYYADKVLVSDGTVAGYGLPMRLSAGAEIAAIEAADVVVPAVAVFTGVSDSGVNMGSPDQIVGMPVDEVLKLGRQDVLDNLGGIDLTPIRLKCALLGLGVLKAAIYTYKGQKPVFEEREEDMYV